MVVYDREDDGVRRQIGRLNQKLVGADEGLPDTYGLEPQALADFLNEWHADARRR